MNICMISFHSCPFSLLGGNGTGGMSVYLKELSFALSRFPGVNIDIFTRVQNPELVGVKNITPQIRVIHLKGGPCLSVDKRKLFSFLPQFTKNLERFILREGREYHLVSSHYWLSGLVGEWIKYRFGWPLVHTYHTLDFLKKNVSSQDEHPSRRKAERYLAYTSDAIISSSWQEKRNLVHHYKVSGNKVKVIYPGVNQYLFYPSPSKPFLPDGNGNENSYTLLYVGRIEPIKGLMTVVKSFARLKENKEDIYNRLNLVVIGGGTEKELFKNREVLSVQKFIQQKGLEEKVSFLGSKRQVQLKTYYSDAAAVVVPSFYESFGLVVTEALACGTPVIASEIGKIKTIIKEGKNGFCFLPGDPHSLSQCIKEFLTKKHNLWDRKRIRKDVVTKFSWEKTATHTYRVYKEVEKEEHYSTTILLPDETPQPV